jgi:hypothetical protein
MKISTIYDKYFIPINLQKHMLMVAALGSLICEHFANKDLDKDLIVKTLLLHDMGNILKFDFERLDLFEEADKKNIKVYKKAQCDYREKYGLDADVATLKIIKEVTTDQRIAKLCEEAHWTNLKKFINTHSWDIKICIYCDMRIGPFGLLTLTERIKDLKKRRTEEGEDLDDLQKLGILVEKQLNKMTDGYLAAITSNLIEEKREKLLDVSL